MSIQACHCGWSKETSYKGLRIHQGKKGCIPKGMRIPENEQYQFNSYRPKLTYMGPVINEEEPVMTIFTHPLTSKREQYTLVNQWEASHQNDSRRISWTTQVRKEPLLMPMSQMFITQASPSVAEVTVEETNKSVFETPPHYSTKHQTASNVCRALDVSTGAQQVGQLPWDHPTTTAQETAVRPKERKKKEREKEAQRNVPVSPNLTASTTPTEAAVIEVIKSFMAPQQGSLQMNTNSDKSHQALDFASGAQPLLMPMSQMSITQASPSVAEVTVEETNKSAFETPPHYSTKHQTASNVRRALDVSTGAEQVGQLPWDHPTTTAQETAVRPKERKKKEREKEAQRNVPVSPNLTASATPTEAAVIEVIKSFMAPQQGSLQMNTNSDKSHQALDFASGAQPLLMPMSQMSITQASPSVAEVTVEETNKSAFETPPRYSTKHQTASNVRRALDFSTGAQQVGQLWNVPTTTAQETAVGPTEREKEMEREREEEREAQKLQKVRQDRITAELQQKIQTREQKMAEVRSSVKACKGGLDAEWLEIDSAFSEVMRVVEDARQKALQPLEKRRERVKREARDLVQKLQKEIDELKKTIDELDKNPDLQDSSLTGLEEYQDWKNVTVDTSFSFGSLRTTTSNMMEQIHQKLEKLSSVELKRIPTFAVDVKLDPTTAHRCLDLSDDGKMVRDGGMNQRVPDAPQRFDMFGSILGLNRLTSGKSYWEVEVTNKTGWDLGVARRNTNRKGKLSLNPDNGYWVTVHYEGGKYAALTTPPVPISLKEKPQKVGVFVDYEEGLVSFYDVTAQSHIYSFTECSFSDEILPYFSPHLKQNEKNSHPLIISAVKRQQ